MLDIALQRLVDRKITTAREIAKLADVSTSSVYRWINGESQPDFDSIRKLLRNFRNHHAQRDILMVFTAGTAWQLVHVEEAQVANPNDPSEAVEILDNWIQSVQTMIDDLKRVRGQLQLGQPPAAIHNVESLNLLNQIGQQCVLTQRHLVDLHDQSDDRQ